jgi:undecaprenyl-diphosphatase
LFDRVRPDAVAVSDLITQASYPSGHVVRTVVALGLLAYIWTESPRARTLAFALVIAVSLVMGVARVASGEHWPTDVVGGFLFSGAILAIAVASASGSFRRSQISPRS